MSSVVSSDSDEEDLATRLVAPPPVPESSYSSSDVSSSDSDSSNEEEAQSQEAVAGILMTDSSPLLSLDRIVRTLCNASELQSSPSPTPAAHGSSLIDWLETGYGQPL